MNITQKIGSMYSVWAGECQNYRSVQARLLRHWFWAWSWQGLHAKCASTKRHICKHCPHYGKVTVRCAGWHMRPWCCNITFKCPSLILRSPIFTQAPLFARVSYLWSRKHLLALLSLKSETWLIESDGGDLFYLSPMSSGWLRHRVQTVCPPSLIVGRKFSEKLRVKIIKTVRINVTRTKHWFDLNSFMTINIHQSKTGQRITGR